MSAKRQYPFPYKTVANENTLEVSEISIENITIQSPTSYPTYTLTLPINDGAPGQILSTDGTGVLSWVNDAGSVTSVSATTPLTSSGGTTPTISLSTAVPTTLGGTGLTIVGTNGQVLTSNGTVLSWQTPAPPGIGTVTSVSASVPGLLSVTVSNPTSTPTIAISYSGSALPFANGGTGLTTLGTFGQVLTTNGINMLWDTLPTYVSSVSAGSLAPFLDLTVLNPTTTPQIGLSFTGTALPVANGGTGLTSVGTFGQVLTTNGINMLWDTLPASVTSVTASSPISSSGGSTPNITLSTVPTTLGGTGLTTVGTNGQVLQSNGTVLQYVTLPTPVTSVSGTSPVNSSGGATPTISLSTIPTTLGGTGLTTVGTNGQVLTSNGTTLSWQTPSAPGTGTVTSVSASVPAWLSVTVTNPNTTPAIAITGSSTGTGTVSVLQDSPTINNTLTISDKIEIPRNSSNGEAIRIHNANTSFPSVNYIVVGHNSSARNHAHFGHNIVSSGSTSNYAYIETNSNRFVFTGAANFALPVTTGTAGQALITDGSGNTSWTTLTTGTVTSVSGTSPVNSSGGATPTISLSTIPTTLGGTGLTTVGTNGQVLTSNGTSLTWTTPTSTGTVTSVSASVPSFLSVTVSNPTTTPAIAISGTSTGTGSVVLQTSPTINDTLTITNPITTFFDSITSYAPNLGVSHSNIFRIGKSSTSGENGYIQYLYQNNFSNRVIMGIGVNQISVNMSGQFSAPGVLGSSSSWNFNPTTISFSSSGASLQITNSGGTSGTQNTLQVIGSGLTTGAVQTVIGQSSSTAGNFVSFGWKHDPTLGNRYGYINTNNANVMTFATNGNVGIGTSSPTAKLHVVANNPDATMILENTSSSGFAVAQFKTTTQLCNIGVGGPSSGVNDAFYIFFGAAVRFLMDVSGNVTLGAALSVSGNLGIGTTTPTQKLHVVDSGTADTVSIQNTNASGYASISFDTTTQDFTLGVGGPTATAFSGALQNKIYFYYNTDVRVVIDTSGNFGIGTTSPSTKLQVNGTTRSTNFTTNGTNTFTYASGTFTPRIAMFYTSDGKVYECNNAPAGKDNMGITYSVQTGLWVRVGNLVTVNMEIQYSQTYAGITFDLTNLNIVAVIPEAACNPSTLGAVGMTGYPSRIADRFEDNFQMNYWISNTSYAPGGTICEVQLRRNNTHNMMPWDPTSKSGQRLNITTSYYVNQ